MCGSASARMRACTCGEGLGLGCRRALRRRDRLHIPGLGFSVPRPWPGRYNNGCLPQLQACSYTAGPHDAKPHAFRPAIGSLAQAARSQRNPTLPAHRRPKMRYPTSSAPGPHRRVCRSPPRGRSSFMIADGLSRIAMSSGLATSLSRATDYARAQGHAEVTLEHMLLALCDDPDAALVLAASNVDVARTASAEVGALARPAADGVRPRPDVDPVCRPTCAHPRGRSGCGPRWTAAGNQRRDRARGHHRRRQERRGAAS